MPRVKKAIPNVKLEVQVPAHLHSMLRLHLFSETEGRVPFGATSEFVTALLQNYFDRLKENAVVGGPPA